MQRYAGFAALVLVVALGAFLATGIPALQDRAPEESDLLLGLLASLTLLPASLAFLRADGDVLDPVSVTGGLFFLYFVLRALYLLYGSPRIDDLPPRLGMQYREFVGPALAFTLACWSAALAGYYLPFGHLAARRLPPVKAWRGPIDSRRVMVLFWIGVLFRGIQVARGTHLAFAKSETADLSTQSYVDLGCQLDHIALYLLSALHFQRLLDRRTQLMLWAVVLPETVLMGFISGSKWLMLLPIIAVLSASHYFRSKLQLRHGFAFIAVFVFVAIPMGQSMRSAYGQANTRATDFSLDGTQKTAMLAAANVRESVNDDFDGYVENALRATTSRMHGLDSEMVALKMTPEFIPYVDPSLYYLSPLMAVAPRILWKNKPVMDPVPGWATDYWGQSPDSPSSIATTHTGALYLAFGWGGAVVGMALLGILWRIIYAYPARFGGPLARASYHFVLLAIMRIENDIPSVYVGITKIVLLLAIVSWAARQRVPEPLAAVRSSPRRPPLRAARSGT